MTIHGKAKELGVTGQQCPISLVELNNEDNVSILNCGHLFIQDKLIEWYVRRPICPVCRAPIESMCHASSDLELYRQMVFSAITGYIEFETNSEPFCLPLSVLAAVYSNIHDKD